MSLFKSRFREKVQRDIENLFEYTHVKHELMKLMIGRLELQHLTMQKGIDAQLNHYHNIRFNILDMLRSSKGALVSDLDVIGCKAININMVKSHFDKLITELEGRLNAESEEEQPKAETTETPQGNDQADTPQHDEAGAGQ